jgi:hypothetical protein
VTVNGSPVRGWRVLPLPLDRIGPVADALRVPAPATGTGAPATGTGAPAIEPARPRPAPACPQGTLYVPGPVTRKDGNELILLELGAASGNVEFVSGPDLGHTER